MSRLAECFDTLKKQGQKGLIPYIVAGDPSLDVTVPMMHELVLKGANVIELGVPFSDPMAEGKVIQLAHERALEHNTSLRNALEMVREFRLDNNDTQIVLMGYANPIEVMGYAEFATVAGQVGVDAILTVDMPPEEATELVSELDRVAIDNIMLIAPTTGEERISRIVASASGFLYYVALKGVTGAGNLDVGSVSDACLAISNQSTLPLAVGFGIKDAKSATAIALAADAVVVGSALVDAMANFSLNSDDVATLCKNSSQLIGEIRMALDA